MKRRVLSMFLALCMLCATCLCFSVTANADGSAITISEQYYEKIFECTSTVSTHSMSFIVPYTGYYIIQTFGHPIAATSIHDIEDNGYTQSLKLL